MSRRRKVPKPEDSRPPVERPVCQACGGTGVDNGEIDSPTDSCLPEELRAPWQAQMRNRPTVYKCMEMWLAHMRAEHLTEHIALSDYFDEMAGWCSRQASALESMDEHGEFDSLQRGELRLCILHELAEFIATGIWILAERGSPQINTMAEYIRVDRAVRSDMDDEDEEDQE